LGDIEGDGAGGAALEEEASADMVVVVWRDAVAVMFGGIG